jgi:hypothetical protein
VIPIYQFCPQEQSDMAAHKFRTGQSVRIARGDFEERLGGTYEIVRLLPQERGINQYRIKAAAGGQERVVSEGELV